MAAITLKNILKCYEKNVPVVEDFNLEIRDKEFVVLVGPSGCGKSTVLRMIAGLEEITGGELYFDETLVNALEPKARNIAMVFQNYALYPHMTVYDNIAFGLKMRKEPKKVIDEKVRTAAEMLEISDLLKRKPKALSGGQRQRVAIGRAIVRSPQAFLMDEPLSNLDAKLRGQMRTQLIRLRRSLDTTFLYVTHDQTEAMTLGDRIVVMNKGHIMQVGTPAEVFARPANLFVAGFIGTPQMNFLPAVLRVSGGECRAELLGTSLLLPAAQPDEALDGRQIIFGIRPEHVLVSAEDGIGASVDVCELMGSSRGLHLRCAGESIEAILPATEAEAPAAEEFSRCALRFDLRFCHLFDAETEQRITL